MTKILSLVAFHIIIYFSTDFWWANAAIAVIFGFLYHTSVKWWWQVLIVFAIVLGNALGINTLNENRLAEQLIQVFGLSQAWLLPLFSAILIALGVLLGQWTGRSIRTNLRPVYGH